MNIMTTGTPIIGRFTATPHKDRDKNHMSRSVYYYHETFPVSRLSSETRASKVIHMETALIPTGTARTHHSQPLTSMVFNITCMTAAVCVLCSPCNTS